MDVDMGNDIDEDSSGNNTEEDAEYLRNPHEIALEMQILLTVTEITWMKMTVVMIVLRTKVRMILIVVQQAAQTWRVLL